MMRKDSLDLVGISTTIGIALLYVALFAWYASLAFGHEGSSDLDRWYRSLVQPGTQISCCGGYDCHPTEYRMTKAGDYEALNQNGKWVTVPQGKVLRNIPNLTGRAVLCWNPALGVLCFIRPLES